MIASYRDPRYAASIRIQQLRADATEGVPEEATRIHAARVARSWAGAAAILGFVLMILASIAHFLGPNAWHRAGVHPTLVLVGALVLSMATYVIARSAAARSFPRSVWSSFDASDDELARLARLEGDSVRRAALRLAGSGEKASVALPMAGIGLLAPLTIHLAVWSSTQVTELGSPRWLEGFDWWIGASLMLVGVAHATLAVLCCVFAGRMSRASVAFLRSKTPMSGWGVLGWTVLASCLPGLLAFAIPVVVVLGTGLLFIPWMFGSMHRTVVNERIALDAD